MAKISLRMYNREIEGLIEQGQRLDEAIAHCRHILQTYPKHLETYRLLGKAYLEAKRYDQAVDIFQRVLVATPDDFVSHVGMSIIADDKGRLDDAIWHMERAFEVQPSNAAIQGELQRLFGRRDGVEPPKIRLTRGALAHMYVQGELYNQAISEIRAVLSGDAKRTDMQTLLARAYFRNGQKAEAADICGELLAKYPYCLEANRLMVEIAPGTPRADMAQEYRQRVTELDPYTAYATDSVFRADAVPDNMVTIERLEYTGETAEMPPTLGIGLESESTIMSGPVSGGPAVMPGKAEPANLPEWLRDTGDTEAPATTPTPSVPDQNDIPEFLRQAGWGASSGSNVEESAAPFEEQPSSEPTAVEGELPEWVKALAPTGEDTAPSGPMPPSVESETPDWLRGLGDEEVTQPPAAKPESPLASSEAPTLPPDAPDWLRELGPVPTENLQPAARLAEETPDWLKGLADHEIDEPAAPAKKESETDWLGELRAEQPPAVSTQPEQDATPDWLREFGNDLETPMARVPEAPSLEPAAPETLDSLGSLGTTAQEQDDAMAWLESLAAKHGAKPEELVTDPNARTDVAPEWVDKAKEIGEQAPEPAQVAQPAEPAQPTGPARPEQPAEDETGMWLRNLAADADKLPEAEPAEPEAVKQEPPIMAESETPDWLAELTPMPGDRSGMEDAPEWLRAVSSEEPEQPAAPQRAEADIPTEPISGMPEAALLPEPEEGAESLPAWLAGLDKEESEMVPPTSGAQASDELPAWLKSEAEPEPEAMEPANPADWRPIQPLEETPPAEAQPAAVEARTHPVTEPTRAREPVAPPPEPPRIETPPISTPAAEPVRAEKAPVSAPPPEPVRIEKAPVAAPRPERPKPAPSAPAKAATVSLGDAQSQLGRGNIAAALDIYGRLIRKGKSLEDIIRDLRDALYRYPVEVPLWQSLGDAYMRANRLQEALDAYTKAEELLR